MTLDELEQIRAWDRRCGDNEGTFFPVTKDRRRLLEYVDELLAALAVRDRSSARDPRLPADRPAD